MTGRLFSRTKASVRNSLLPAETAVHNKGLSAEFVRDLLLPAKTVVHERWLSAKFVCVFLLPDRKHEIADSLCGNQI